MPMLVRVMCSPVMGVLGSFGRPRRSAMARWACSGAGVRRG